MACRSKDNIINKLRKEEIIDKYGYISNLDKFNLLNTEYSNLAINKYGVDLEGNKLLSLSPNNKYSITNKSYFTAIDDAVKEYKSNNPKISSLKNDSTEDIFVTEIKRYNLLKTNSIEIPGLENIEEKQDFVISRIKSSLELSLKEYKEYIAKNKNTDSAKLKKVEESAKEFKKLKEKIEEYAESKKWKAIITFTKTMNSNLFKLQERLKKEDLDREDAREAIERYENYLAAYNLLDDVSEIISDEQYINDKNVSRKDRTQIKNLISDTAGKHKILTDNFKSAIKKFVIKDLSTLKNQPEVERNWINKLKKQYRDLKISTISEDEFISREMNTTYKDEIQEDVEIAANKTVNEVSFDISSATSFLNSSINTNSKLVQIFQSILNDIRDTIINSVRKNDLILKDLYSEFIKGKKNKKPSNLYKNILEQNSEGTYYLKGEYSSKFYEEYRKSLKLSPKEESKWLKENTDIIQDKNGKFIGRKPSSKWKNNLSSLSDSELKILEHFKNQTEEGDKLTFGIKSLKDTFYNVSFYKLPSIVKSDLERTLEGDAKGVLTDKWKDLTQIRPDDIGYEKRAVRIDNTSINYVPIHYRGKIDSKDQSLDLFTLYRLEYQNTINYSTKQSRELELNNIIDISKQKKYVSTTGNKVPIISKLFGGNIQTIKGEESNTYKRLNSLMEKNIYDVLHKYQGKWGPVDVNKAINLANSWTATIGLSLNMFSATANALNGNTQLFLESLGKDIFNKKDLSKAQRKYLADTANNFNDLNKPIKTSFTNQLNQEFDTFGLATVSTQSFIENSYLKSFADPSTLQFMHQTGEHQMQSVLTMSVLNSIKVFDKNSKAIKINDKDATLLDAYTIKEGELILDDRVVYTSHTPGIKYNEGGKSQINSLVKKKLFDTMGNYDQQMQVDATRYAAGKIFLMYRKFLVPLGIRRFRGLTKSYKPKEALEDKDKFFSYSLKDYEEGIYTSLIRHFTQGVLPALKRMKYDIMSKDWDSLSDHEKSNIKIAVTEIILTAVILPLLGGIISHLAEGADEEDEKYFFFAMYELRRLESELSQYRDITEAWKIIRSPIPSIRVLENATSALYRTMSPWTWDDEFKSGKRKGDLKIIRSYEKLIPILNRKDVEAKELYKYIDNNFGF